MSSNSRHAETAGRDLKRFFDSDHAANRLLSLALAISFIINACRRADIDSSTATQTGGSPASPLPTEFDGTPVLVASPPTGEVISSATPLPPTETPLPILTPTATPDLRIQSVSIETARSFLGVALPAASEALASAASNTPYLADVYSETFLSQQLDSGSLSPETRSLYQDLLAQITQMRAAKGVGSLCGPDSLVFHNGRFGSYFRAMPLCITPDGSSMVWLQGFDGRLSSHSSIAQGIDATRYSWEQFSLEGVRPEEIAAVVNRGNFTVAAKDETKGGEILSKAFVTAEKQWVGAERLPTSCLDGEQNQKIVDQFLAANGFSDLKEAMSNFVNKYGEGKRVWMHTRGIVDPATQKTIGYNYEMAYTETLLLGEYQIPVDRNGQSGYLYCPVVALPAGNPDGANVLALISDGTLNGVWSGRPIYDLKGHVVDVQNTPRTEAEARRWFADRVGKSIAVSILITAPQWRLGDGTQDWCFNYYYPFADCPLGDGGEIQHRSVLLPLAENSYLTRFENDISLLEAITDPEYFNPADVAKHLDPELDLGLFATGFHD